LDFLKTIREIDDDTPFFLDFIHHLDKFGFDGKSIEALVLIQSVELIGNEREMRVELMICSVVE